ncbi:Uncharacterized protein TCM_004496 [Theobroma cacao]|uniref:Uncharacterized protein n=1 Tax=Theobroma cacao TaxID=3641 RepID=A0A061DXZ4_THECC|nr:Uncharacterized protein TCM_004496 [Theobroma cacao]
MSMNALKLYIKQLVESMTRFAYSLTLVKHTELLLTSGSLEKSEKSSRQACRLLKTQTIFSPIEIPGASFQQGLEITKVRTIIARGPV